MVTEKAKSSNEAVKPSATSTIEATKLAESNTADAAKQRQKAINSVVIETDEPGGFVEPGDDSEWYSIAERLTHEYELQAEGQALAINSTEQQTAGGGRFALQLLSDESFGARFRVQFTRAMEQLCTAVLDGAARVRVLLSIVKCLMLVHAPVSVIEQFAESTGIARSLLELLNTMLTSAAVKKQAWFAQLVCDVVGALNAYFASEILLSPDTSVKQQRTYRTAALGFVALLEPLLSLDESTDLDVDVHDPELRIAEESLLVTLPSITSFFFAFSLSLNAASVFIVACLLVFNLYFVVCLFLTVHAVRVRTHGESERLSGTFGVGIL